MGCATIIKHAQIAFLYLTQELYYLQLPSYNRVEKALLACQKIKE